jgi:hypothetical protein
MLPNIFYYEQVYYNNINKSIFILNGGKKMNPANKDIRTAIKQSGLKQWIVAENCGQTEFYFSRMLRHELATTAKKEIFGVIEKLKSEKEGDDHE